MRITPPGLLTEGNTSDDALILEARWLLAYRYNWDGRCKEACQCLVGAGRFNIKELMDYWDTYNVMMGNKARQEYFINTRMDPDPWGELPTIPPPSEF